MIALRCKDDLHSDLILLYSEMRRSHSAEWDLQTRIQPRTTETSWHSFLARCNMLCNMLKRLVLWNSSQHCISWYWRAKLANSLALSLMNGVNDLEAFLSIWNCRSTTVLTAITESLLMAVSFLRSVTYKVPSRRHVSFSQILIPQNSLDSLNSPSQSPNKVPMHSLFTLFRSFSTSGSTSTILNESLWSFICKTFTRKRKPATKHIKRIFSFLASKFKNFLPSASPCTALNFMNACQEHRIASRSAIVNFAHLP